MSAPEHRITLLGMGYEHSAGVINQKDISEVRKLALSCTKGSGYTDWYVSACIRRANIRWCRRPTRTRLITGGRDFWFDKRLNGGPLSH